MADLQSNNLSRGGRGRHGRDIMRIRDAFIEEITQGNRSLLVTVSYGIEDEFSTINMELLTLVVSQDTIIRNQSGRDIPMRDLREGMRIDADVSTAWTMSIPPQTRAYRITVRRGQDWQDSSMVSEGIIVNVDTRNNYLIAGPLNNISRVVRYVITDSTIIRDRRGNRIRLRDLRPGQLVRIEHATFQTRSIPPQTTAFRVQVI